MLFPKPSRVRNRAAIEEVKKEYCEVCGASTVNYQTGKIIDPHHIFTQGAGGSDIKENLIQLCWNCHYIKLPAGKLQRSFLLSIVAKRERKTVEDLENIINKSRGRNV